MNHAQDIPAYGLWSLVAINSAVFIIFAFGFFKPKTKRDWRTFGGFPNSKLRIHAQQAFITASMSSAAVPGGSGTKFVQGQHDCFVSC